MYVGKTDRSLRTRFREYISEKNDPKGRRSLRMLFQLYDGYLYFHFCALQSGESPTQIEEDLMAAYLPPINDSLPAQVRAVMKAFN
jgi:hypothetical protein